MCLAYRIGVFPVSPLGHRSVFAACGKCEECKAVAKSSWCFRLTAELEHAIKQNYRVVFFTLTYNDLSLPRLGQDCFCDEYLHDIYSIIKSKPLVGTPDGVRLDSFMRYCNTPCFSRDHVEKFVHAVREWLWRNYDVRDCIYFGAGEFGSHTRRPHYHFLMAVPPNVDCELMHTFICSYWAMGNSKRPAYGHVFPRYFSGGVDSHGYKHKPFVVESPLAAARYCAKYATKDCYYDEFLRDSGIDDTILDLHKRETKRKLVFHVQKKSLGACILVGLDDKSKLDLLRVGMAFTGDSDFRKIPIYIKNKLLFDGYYIYEPATITHPRDGKELGVIALGETYTFKRLVRRKASEFFQRNSKEIYDLKVASYVEFFKNLSDLSCYESRGISPEFANYGVRVMQYLANTYSYEFCARMFLLYDGIEPSDRYFVDTLDEHLLYLLRFVPSPDVTGFLKGGSAPSVDEVLHLLGLAIGCYFITPVSRSEAQRLEDRIIDFFGHLDTAS